MKPPARFLPYKYRHFFSRLETPRKMLSGPERPCQQGRALFPVTAFRCAVRANSRYPLSRTQKAPERGFVDAPPAMVYSDRAKWTSEFSLIPVVMPRVLMKRTEKRKSASPKRQVARFLIIFFGLWAILWAIPYVLGTFPPGVKRLCPITAAWLGNILSLLGFQTAVDGVSVNFGSTGLTIIAECTGYTAMALFFSVVVAYPSPIAKKLIGLAIGIPLILAFNMFRLVVMAVVLAYKPQYFELAHLYFWQVALIIFVVAIVIFWIEKLVGREKALPVSS